MSDIPKVALLVDTSYGVRRDMLLGITRFIRQHGPWSLYVTSGEHKSVLPEMRQWRGNGIIARIPDERTEQAVIDAALPTICLCLSENENRLRESLSLLSNVSFDAASEVSRLAVLHFVERRFRNFAYIGFDNVGWSQLRETAFCEELRRLGFTPLAYRQPSRLSDRVWENEQPLLTKWISELPKPIAILACNDDRGRQVLEACRFSDVEVPEEVAVLGVDNDEIFCDVADPPLSSIALDAEDAGFQAAELLDGMMRGRVSKPEAVNVRALRVVTRRSSDVFAVNDSDVSAALKYIRRERGRDISVTDVADAVAISRRSLEKRFREVVGRTVLDEIQRARLAHAKQLLAETSYPISKVADLAGFGNTDYFVRFFHRRVGMTPRDFRKTSAV